MEAWLQELEQRQMPLDSGEGTTTSAGHGDSLSLAGNLDLEACRAENEYQAGNFELSYEISQR